MTPVITIAIVLIVNELTRPGDLEAGDVIALPDELGRIMIRAVRLGRAGSSSRLAPQMAPAPGVERQVTLTAAARVHRFGRARAL